MKYSHIYWNDLRVQLHAATFITEGGVPEVHSILELTDPSLDAAAQFLNMQTAIQRTAHDPAFKGTRLVWKRFFVSDAANQYSYINDEAGAISSLVQQPPLNGSKVAVWLYHVGGDGIVEKEANTLALQRPGGNKYLYTTQLTIPLKNEFAETEGIFNAYIQTLRRYRASLKENCIRTWIFVQGVDIHYGDMVKARNACFEKEGLTKDTHYIASTGIEGRHVDPCSLVLMDAYAIAGIKPGQVKHLYATTHLNRTHNYGVTFERGTSVDFADRRHVYISGTASINNQGEIEHPLQVMKQLDRVLENVATLLSEAECDWADVVQMIVYLRDIADYAVVKAFFDKHYRCIPKVIVWAPVCRSGWLVEMECIAIKSRENDGFPCF